MDRYYCETCDVEMHNRHKERHIKTKQHIEYEKAVVIIKKDIGDIMISSLEEAINDIFYEYSRKFRLFLIKTRGTIEHERYEILTTCENQYARVYEYVDDSEEMRFKEVPGKNEIYEYFNTILLAYHILDFHPNYLIKDITITLHLYYYTMKRRHRLEQPRPVFHSKMLKQLVHRPRDEIFNNYRHMIGRYGFSLFKPINEIENR